LALPYVVSRWKHLDRNQLANLLSWKQLAMVATAQGGDSLLVDMMVKDWREAGFFFFSFLSLSIV
jgi:hypothetical protein